METRSLLTNFRGDGNKLHGTIPYNSPTQILEEGRMFTEIIRPTAFRRALASGGRILATLNHDPSKLLGTTHSGTLALRDEPDGLRFEVDLPDTPTGNEVRTLVQRGDLNGASFTFTVRKGGDKWTDNTRELVDVFLYELGPVALPAYSTSALGLRNLDFDLLEWQLRIAEKL